MAKLQSPDSSSAYPTAQEVTDQEGAAQDKAKQATDGQSNPVIDAIKTLAMFAKAQADQGNGAPITALQEFIKALQGGGEESEAPQDGEQPPMEQAPDMPMPKKGGMIPESQMSKVNNMKQKSAKVF